MVVQEPDRYHAAQHCLADACAAWTPQVEGASGRCDLDLAGTETLWRRRLHDAEEATVEDLAERIARELRQQCLTTLHLPAVIGGSMRLVVSRLAAALARDARACPHGVLVITPGHEATVDALPVSRLDGCPPAVRRLLAECGISTIGALRALTAADLSAMAGSAGDDLHRLLHGDDPVIAGQADPEPVVVAGAHADAHGAGPVEARAMLASLAREVGWGLRLRAVAAGRLTLVARWRDGRQAEATVTPAQVHHDHDIAVLALRLLDRLDTRRVHWDRLRLTASRLCIVEEQARLFGPAKATRLEAARDRIRTRFGTDLVRAATAPTDLTCEA